MKGVIQFVNKAIGIQILPLLNQMCKQELITLPERDEFVTMTKKAMTSNQRLYYALFMKLNALNQKERTQQERSLLEKAMGILQRVN